MRRGGHIEPLLAWTYPEPRHDASAVAGQVCFFNERVDLEVDGELQARPITRWSKPDWAGAAPVLEEGGA